MANQIRRFSDEEIRAIKELIRENSTERYNTPSRSPTDSQWNGTDDYPAPDIWVAEVLEPAAHIPAIIPGAGTTGAEPGQALCRIFRLNSNRNIGAIKEPELQDTGMVRRVFNIKTLPITNSRYFLAAKTKNGTFVAIDQANGMTKLVSAESSKLLGPIGNLGTAGAGGVDRLGYVYIVDENDTVLYELGTFVADLTSCYGLVFPAQDGGLGTAFFSLSIANTCWGVWNGTKFRVSDGGITEFVGITLSGGVTVSGILVESTPALCGEIMPDGVTVYAGLMGNASGANIVIKGRCC